MRKLLSEMYGGPIFEISDLHMGDGGPRDNFAYGNREKELDSFLDHVEDHHGRLIICGDLFELWQSNISKVLTKRMPLLDRLARMEATYILGNHDIDLRYFVHSKGWLTHPFFDRMCIACYARVCGQTFRFIHGHEADPYCSNEAPGLGRITAILSGLAEDKNGSPMLDKYRTVEDRVVGPMEKAVSLWNRLCGKPDRFTEINRRLYDMRDTNVIISGHTHFAGRIGTWHYNSGTWAERVNSFVRVNNDATVQVYDWIDGDPVPNNKELPI